MVKPVKKRIFLNICLACFLTLLLTTALIVGVIYEKSTIEVKKEVITQSYFISKAMELSADSGFDYITTIGKESENRVTLVSSSGKVIYDSFVSADILENHYNRPEIKSAISNGSGETTRLSDTLRKRTYYYAVRLDDGNVLRIAATGKSALGLIKSAVIWIVLIVLSILFLSIIIAKSITASIVEPINKLNIDEPLINNTYDELSPLLSRLEKQNKKIEKQLSDLSEQQQEFAYITGAMSEGLVIFNERGTVLFQNNSAKNVLGDAVGKSYLELYRDVNYIRAIESAISGKSFTVKINRNGKDYQLSANPVKGNSNLNAAVLLVMDITEKEQVEKMRREFSANVSHELKTPLTSIMGYAEIIENGIAKQEDIPNFANRIHTEAARLLTLIEDIIRLSKIDEGNLKQEFEYVELSELCQSVINELYEKGKSKQVSLQFIGSTASVYGIRQILREMIFNLCDNAINYNKDDGNVTVKLLIKNKNAQLSVSDTGIGIATEHQNRIFERFYRVDKSHSKDTGGTGLGLSIVKHSALLHRAKITVDSQVGKGTTITITFEK